MFDELDNEVARFLSAPAFNKQTQNLPYSQAPAEHTAWREQLQGKTHPKKMQAYVVEQAQLQEAILNKSLNRKSPNIAEEQQNNNTTMIQQQQQQQQNNMMDSITSGMNNTSISRANKGNKSTQLIREKRQRRRESKKLKERKSKKSLGDIHTLPWGQSRQAVLLNTKVPLGQT